MCRHFGISCQCLRIRRRRRGGSFGKINIKSFRGMTLMCPTMFRDCFEGWWQDGFLICICIDGAHVYRVVGLLNWTCV